jgi:hypothetical protein
VAVRPRCLGGLISASLAAPLAAIGAPGIFATAVGVHTVSLLLVTGIVAAVVYEKLGVALLRRAWVNLDLVWSVALLGAGVATLML